jgi:hypothetical protein
VIEQTYRADAVLPAMPRARIRTRSSGREHARRRVVSLVLLIYLLLIFEGSVRKWLLPQWSSLIFFVRDPFLLYTYLLASRHKLWPKREVLLWLFLCMAAAGVLIGVASLGMGPASESAATLALYGWRNYFLYPPLAFLIGAQFSLQDLRRFWRWTLLLAGPIGVLVAVQFASPPNAPINIGSASEAAFQFRGMALDADHVRPMGTFSSVAAQTQFVISTFAILLGLLITPPRRRGVPRWLLLSGLAGVATCVALGGNRSALVGCAVIAALGMVFGILSRSGAVKRRALLLPVVVAIAFAVAFPILFQKGFEVFSYRWQTAGAAEAKVGGILGRTLDAYVDLLRVVGDAPVLGYGLGTGGNAAITLGIAGENSAIPYAEADWTRHIVDLGPALGLCYIGLRIALTIWLGLVALKATRRGAGPLPLLLFAYAALMLLNGQITGQGAINGYAWIFAGLTIAAAAARPATARRLRTPSQ